MALRRPQGVEVHHLLRQNEVQRTRGLTGGCCTKDQVLAKRPAPASNSSTADPAAELRRAPLPDRTGCVPAKVGCPDRRGPLRFPEVGGRLGAALWTAMAFTPEAQRCKE